MRNKIKLKLFIFILFFIFFINFSSFLYSQSNSFKHIYFLYNDYVLVAFTQPYKYPYGQSPCEIIINEVLSKAKEFIRIMIFDIDSSNIINKLIKKNKEKVDIKMIIDENNTPVEAKDILVQKNFIIPYKNSKYMHHKIIIVDNKFLITGSANFTVNCLYFNNNDMIVFSKEKLTFLKDLFLNKNIKDDIENKNINNISDQEIKKEISNIIDYFSWYFGLFKNSETLKKSLIQKENKFSLNRKKLRILFTRFIYKDSEEKTYEVNDVIKEYVNRTNKRILFAYSTFTNFEIANLIINRIKNNRLIFFGILENLNTGSKYSVYRLFEENNLNIFKDKNQGIMHNKFIIFDDVLITGSYAIADRENRISSKKYNDDLIFVFHDNTFTNIYYNYLEYLIGNYY